MKNNITTEVFFCWIFKLKALSLYRVTVAPEDMGKVIGKQGRIAKSIRTVVKAAASKGDKKVIVDIK